MARPILLAVDDDVNVLEAVVQDLRREYGAGYRVMRAASGQAALDTLTQLKTRQEPVALLISDQRMPGMTGVDFLERARPIFPDARRVLLTAYADNEAAIRAINSARIHSVSYTHLTENDAHEAGRLLFPRCGGLKGTAKTVVGAWRLVEAGK